MSPQGRAGIVLPLLSSASYWQQRIRLTPLAERILSGAVDRIEAGGIDRWLGGAHLLGRHVRRR